MKKKVGNVDKIKFQLKRISDGKIEIKSAPRVHQLFVA